MMEIGSDTQFADRSRVIAVIGVLLLFVGVAAAALGPMELYCFYLFAEGGRFHYEGFGFGSFMFAVIAIQVAGYYVIAMICISLGVGASEAASMGQEAFSELLGLLVHCGRALGHRVHGDAGDLEEALVGHWCRCTAFTGAAISCHSRVAETVLPQQGCQDDL